MHELQSLAERLRSLTDELEVSLAKLPSDSRNRNAIAQAVEDVRLGAEDLEGSIRYALGR